MAISRRAMLSGAIAGALCAMSARAQKGEGRTFPLRFMKLRHASLLVEIGGRRVLVDPWLSRGPGGGLLISTDESPIEASALGSIDLILLTSSMPDRLDVATLQALPDKGARCLVPDERAAKACRHAGYGRARVVGAGETWRTLGLDVSTFACRAEGLVPASVGYHLGQGGRSVLVVGALVPLVVDDGVGRFARENPAEVVFLPRPHRATAPGDLAASDEDLILVARLARARAVVPVADAVVPGPLAAPLLDAVLENRPANLVLPTEAPRVSLFDVDRAGHRVRMPRALHVENGVWYRLGVDGASGRASSDIR